MDESKYGALPPEGWVDPNAILGILVEHFGTEEQYLNDVESHAKAYTAWRLIMQHIDGPVCEK